MPAISIAHETAEADIMKLKPRDPKKQTLVTSQYVANTFLVPFYKKVIFNHDYF